MNIIKEETTINPAPNIVVYEGNSLKRKKPKPIAYKRARYFSGVVKETSANL